ncbi:hypothetical protein BJX68DRAFT_270712 [Aspergillus pseudodeflectus]|uniref:Uncharacterized protein n=1 Tax=Aspergillus pseudodeflectus TaxID=176178 RepID=A0ABR4JQF8_9EURO
MPISVSHVIYRLSSQVIRRSKGSIFQPQNQSLFAATYGVIFLGTPHRGSFMASWGNIAANVMKAVLRSSNTAVLNQLNVGSEMLDMIAQEFSIMMRNDEVKAYSFWEERPMSGILGFDGKVVPDFSATIGDPSEGKEGIDANQVEMSKFASREDNMYGRVIGAIRLYVDAVEGQTTNDEERQIAQDLETLPTAVRQKILTDRTWNELHLGNISNDVVLRMPRFSEDVLRLGTDYVAPTNGVYGSGAFKLAAILQLLPGQANETLVQADEFGLHELVYDESTYYSRISKRGLLKLVSGKVSRISQEGGSLVAKTSIGSFSFRRIDGKVLIMRIFSDVPPEDIGRLERDDSSPEIWMEDYEESTTTGSHSWTDPVDSSIAIFYPDLDHPRCPRFMRVREYRQLEHQLQHNDDLLTSFIWVTQQRPDFFESFTQPLRLIQVLEHKRVEERRELEVNMSACRLILSELASNLGLQQQADRNRYLARCSNFHDDLLEVYGEGRSRIAMQNHMLDLVERDQPLVTGVSNLALLGRANAKFLLTLAIPAPDMWIEMLLDPERDLWIA